MTKGPSLKKVSKPRGKADAAGKQKRLEPHSPARGAKLSLRGELKKFTREKLVAAALQSFQDVGYRETTVDRIVNLAGTTTPTFYRHFNGKNDLLVPLSLHLKEQCDALLAQMAEEQIASPVAFRGWIEEYLLMWRRIQRLVYAFWDGAQLDENLARRIMPFMIDGTAQLLPLLRARFGEEGAEARRLRISMLTLMLDRMAFLITVESDGTLRDEMIGEFADIMWRAVFAK